MPVSFFDPGMMTARLELQQPVATADGQGGAAVAYAPVAALWARIDPVTHATGELASADTVGVTHRIWIFHRDGVSAGMRFRKGARLFAVAAAYDPDDTRRYLICHCQEDAA